MKCFIRAFLIFFCSLQCFVSCITPRNDSNQERFLEIFRPDNRKKSGLIADNCEWETLMPIISQKEEFVFVFRANCSACISRALECYKTSRDLGHESVMAFLSTVPETDVFSYYFERRFSSTPIICSAPANFSAKEGLYLLEQGRVVSYIPWN